MEIIRDYVGRLVEAEGLAVRNHLSRGLINGIKVVTGLVSELETLVTEKDVKRVKLDLDKLTKDLVVNCEKGEETSSVGLMRQLRDKARFLKYSFEKSK